jgi:hypothetical protein
LLFIDDQSRFITIYFLKAKSDTLQCFDEFQLAGEKYLGYPVAVLRVDNAGELSFGEFEAYCKWNRITYERTVPDASQQNGVAE